MKLACMDCGTTVNPTSMGVYREVTGWEKIRFGGGANQIIFREETGRLLCPGCGERRKLNMRRGVSNDQQQLL